jgi:hypothetical protein
MGDSIFEFADEFGVESPFETNWVKNDFTSLKNKNPSIIFVNENEIFEANKENILKFKLIAENDYFEISKYNINLTSDNLKLKVLNNKWIVENDYYILSSVFIDKPSQTKVTIYIDQFYKKEFILNFIDPLLEQSTEISNNTSNIQKYSHPNKIKFLKSKEKADSDYMNTYNEYKSYYVSINRLKENCTRDEAFRVFTEANKKELKRLDDLSKAENDNYNNAKGLEVKWNKLDSELEFVINLFNKQMKYSKKNKLDPNLIKAIMFSETEMGTSVKYLKIIKEKEALKKNGETNVGFYQLNLGRVTDWYLYTSVIDKFNINIDKMTHYKDMGNTNDVKLTAGALIIKDIYVKKLKNNNFINFANDHWYNAIIGFKGVSNVGVNHADMAWKLYKKGEHPYTPDFKLF